MIIHLSTNYAPISDKITHGGVERIVKMLAKKQVELGYVVEVFGMETDYPLSDVGYTAIYPEGIQEFKMNDLEKYYSIMNKANQEIYSNIRRDTVIHDHFGFFTASCYGKKILKHQKIIVTLYGMPDNPIYKNIYNNIKQLKKTFHKNLKIICCSYDQQKLFEEKGFIIDDVIYNCIETISTISSNSNKSYADYFISIGTIKPEKGHAKALAIAKKYKEKLIVIGNLEDKIYKQMLISNGMFCVSKNKVTSFSDIIQTLIEHNYLLIEQIPDDLKNQLLKNSLGFIFMPTWREPFAVSVLEAMSFGIPIIHNDTPSILEAVEENAGILYGEDSFSLDIVKQFNREQILEQVKKFSISNAVQKYKYVYYNN